MRAFLIRWGLVLALAASVIVFGATPATASGEGLTAAQLQAQGWTCILVGAPETGLGKTEEGAGAIYAEVGA